MIDLKAILDRFHAAMQRASDAGLSLPNGGTLATAAADGRPSSRIVLLKDADERGFVFYTNLESRKARELRDNPHASICFWWPCLQEQVRVEGPVEPVDDGEADAYWATRPRGSQIGAWASRQSETLPSREELHVRFEALVSRYDGKTVPRPPFWSGYRLRPERIEFWKGREDRLHERELYTRGPEGWLLSLLSP